MDWGKKIKLTFDRPVHYVTRDELSKWAIKNTHGEMIYPESIYMGETDNVVYLGFNNFNNLVLPATLECFGCVRMGSRDLPFLPFSVNFYPQNLHPIPDGREYLKIAGVNISGEIIDYVPPLPNEVYGDLGYLKIATVGVVGTLLEIEIFSTDPAPEFVDVEFSIEGEYCDVNGVPI